MKNLVKLVGIIAIMAIIGFSLVCCDLSDDESGNDYELINGIWFDWDHGIAVTVSNNSGVFTRIYSDTGWSSTSVNIGEQKFKNITKTGNLTWSCENLVYDTSNYSTSWTNSTINLSTDGQTLKTTTPGTSNVTATFSKYPTINGVWEDSVYGIVITINNNSGVFTQIYSSSGWSSTSVKVGEQKFKNITKTDNLTWSCENLVYSTSNYTTSWTNSTINLSADGQTLKTTTPGTSNVTATLTRK
jgi:hypothetical protein